MILIISACILWLILGWVLGQEQGYRLGYIIATEEYCNGEPDPEFIKYAKEYAKKKKRMTECETTIDIII